MAYMTGCLITQMTKYYHIGSQRRRVPTHVRAQRPGSEEAWEGRGLAKHKFDLAGDVKLPACLTFKMGNN